MGEDLLGPSGRLRTLTGERIYDQDLTAYNLQIGGIHTYDAGGTPVLVHNSCEQAASDALRNRLGSIQRAPSLKRRSSCQRLET